MYRLVLLTGKSKGRRLAIKDASVVAGRDADCQIQLADDDEVSRRHAVFEQREDGGVYVKDLGATNEILVNDKPVKEARLNHGDRVELGNTVLQFQSIIHTESETGRRTSHTQGLTAAAVTLIILSQIVFLLFLVLRHKEVMSVPEKTAADDTPPPVVLVEPAKVEDSEADTMAEAEALLRRKEEESSARAAAAAPVEAPPEVSQDIRQLRAEVADLRQQVEGITEPQEPEPAGAADAPPEPVAPQPAEDPLIIRAQAMLDQAATEIARMNLVQADEKLARIQLMAPDFIPAYIERAKLHERRGMLKQAGEQWTEVLNRSGGTPLYEQAAAERIRLARAEMTQRAAPPVAETGAARVPAGRLPRRVRIVDVKQERFPRNDQFEEMRILTVYMKPRPGEKDIDAYNLYVAVTFFDENTDTRQVRPTRAVVPKDALRVDGDWQANQQKSVTAAYIVPRGFRDEERTKFDENMMYMGYVVQVYYRQELQDVEARPKTLHEEVERIPSPFHKPQETEPPL